MFEFTYPLLSEEQKNAYLSRIGCENLSGLSKENLDELVYRHQCSVPFENLDVSAGVPDLSLEAGDLYRKIVVNRRGGFCFELNGSFVLLLRALGYDAVSVMCRVAANRDFLGNLAHRAVLVRLNGKRFLCDVGLGGPMAPFAVELSDERQTCFGETYWIEETYEGWFLQKRLTSDGEEGNVVIFAPQPFLPNDFYPLCRSLIGSPDSFFRKINMVNRRTEDGNINVRDHVLTITKNGIHEEKTFTDTEFRDILKQYFDIDFS